MIWRALSIAIFAATAALVGGTLLVPLDDETPWLSKSTSVYQVAPGEPLDLVITAKVQNLSLRTFAVVPPQAADDVPYELDVAWLDQGGAVRMRRTVVEESRLSWFPVFPSSPPARLVVDGSPQRVADSRTTTLAVKPFLPDGGVVRITPHADGPHLIVEARAEDPVDAVALARALLAPRQSQIDHARDRMGVAWALQSEDERRAGLASTMLPVRAKNTRSTRARMWLRPDADAFAARELLLAPRRSLALNVQGHARIRVSGAGPLQNLTASLVSDGPTAAALTLRDGAPLGLADEREARSHQIDAEGPVSLILGNRGDVDVRFIASIDEATPMDVFAFTPTTRLLHPETAATPVSTLIGPEVRLVRAFRLWAGAPEVLRLHTPGFDRDDKVRVIVWPVLDGPDDVRPRRVTIVGRGDDGHVKLVQRLEVPAKASTFDQAGDILSPGAPATVASLAERSLAGRFIGEPVTLYVRGDAAVTQLSVGSDDEVLAQLGVDGPLTGDERLYPLPLGEATVRNRARPMRSWHATPPSNEAALIESGQAAKLKLMVRLQARPAPGTDDDDGGQRRYQSLEPTSRLVERTAVVWLVPAAPTPPADLVVYCRFEPAADPRKFVFEPAPFDGRLASFLVAPAAALGGSFAIELDGSRWRNGIIRQRKTQLAAPREPGHRTARLDAPPGSALFLRTVAGAGAGGGACATMLRPFRAYPLAPHARIDFLAPKASLSEQWLVVGSLADRAGALGVVIHADPASVSAASLGFTELARVVPTPLAGRVAERLGGPDVTLPVRDSVAVKLASDLERGHYRVTVENVSSSLAFVYAVIELVDPLSKTPAGPQLLSTPPPEDVP